MALLNSSRTWGQWTSLSLFAASGFAVGAWSARQREPLDGKIAWVNGGSRGLGLLVAAEMARRGALVAVTARDQAELQESRRILSEISANPLAIRSDVAQRDQVESAAHQIAEHFGR